MERGDEVTKVIAAIDDTEAAGPVLATARAVAQLFGASVEALHVRSDGFAKASSAAREAGIPLSAVSGDVVESLAQAGASRDVEALVLGTRNEPSQVRPLGSTALELVGTVEKPVVLVPPRATPSRRIRGVLLPLEGTRQTSLAPAQVLGLARDAAVDVLVLHVLDESALPLFTDQPQHETEAWTTEFLARYCPRGLRSVRLALRVGRPEDVVVEVAETSGVDLIALGWHQRLAPGRAAIVRTALERGRLPLMLIPMVPVETRERRKVA
jgi:nucleotide-binding universal stress UspA family protein